jgi:phosphoenolpyruvate carboxykinase (GTP)
MKFGADGRLYAINPEAGFFGVAPAPATTPTPTRWRPCGATRSTPTPRSPSDGDVWWEGMSDTPPAAPPTGAATRGRPRSRRPPRTPTPASPRRRRSARRSRPSGRTPPACRSRPSCSAVAAAPRCRWSPRPPTGSTACSWARSWPSETTAAQQGAVGNLRFDPMAMLPFCGYNMADYFNHWLSVARTPTTTCRRSSSSTGSAATRTAGSCGRATARTAACSSGCSSGCPAPPTRSRPRSVSCPRRRRSTSPAST